MSRLRSNRTIIAASLLMLCSASSLASTVFYKASVKNWSTVNIHYRVGTGAWTVAPGVAMEDACVANGITYKKKVFAETGVEAVFNNGTTWDNQGNKSGQNYLLGADVTVINGDGSMNAAATNPCPPDDLIAPASPAGLAIVGTPMEGNVKLSWSAATDNIGVKGYKIMRDAEVLSSNTAGLIYTDTTATTGAHTYKVIAFDDAKNESIASVIAITVLADPCNVVTPVVTVPPVGTLVDNGEFVKQQYRDFFGREADAAGVTYWSNLLSAGTQTRAEMLQTLLGSSEFQAKAAPITRLYKAFFKRQPDHEGLWYWVGLFGNGKTVTDIAQTFSESPEFKAQYGSLNNEAFVDLVYQNVLGRAADAAGKNYWLGLINEGKQTRGEVMIGFSESAEHVSTSNNHLSLVLAYEGLLRRNISTADYNSNMIKLNAGTSIKQVLNDLMTSDEYKARFGESNGGETGGGVCIDPKPSQPTNLTSPSKTQTTLHLSWTASTDDRGIKGYVITRNGVVIHTTTGLGVTFTDTGLTADTPYTYTVTAKDSRDQLSDASSVLNARTEKEGVLPPTPAFSWNNATVYFVLTDRFVNGDTSNDRSYGRESDKSGTPFNNDLKSGQATFHGGDLKGLKTKIDAGYFTDLGVNAIWITAPYEQIHGWVTGDGQKHYGYHGYYTLDFSNMDANMGTKADLKAMVSAAHDKGIRIIMDVVGNHVGYENMKDMSEYGYGKLTAGWEATAFKSTLSASWDADIKPNVDLTDATAWGKWWGVDWLRSGAAGYTPCNGTDGLTGCVGFLPDFKTENTNTVGLPPLLVTKWTKEGRLSTEQASLDAWFVKTGRPKTVFSHITKWLTDWVRETGIDGYRVDTAKHVEQSNWKILKEEAVRARNDWIAANPVEAAKLTGDTNFWMTGEEWGHGAGRSSYFDNGFNSMINFAFQGAAGNLAGIDPVYANLRQQSNTSKGEALLSYISSHDKGLFGGDRKTGLTALLLAPGAAQIFYGDETGRGNCTGCSGDHAARGDMNWSSINQDLYTHAKKLGTFRNRHIAVGGGAHAKLSDAPYTFSRTTDTDKVVIALNATGSVSISVGSVFADGTLVKDAYSGTTATVSGGKVTINATGVVLLETAN